MTLSAREQFVIKGTCALQAATRRGCSGEDVTKEACIAGYYLISHTLCHINININIVLIVTIMIDDYHH